MNNKNFFSVPFFGVINFGFFFVREYKFNIYIQALSQAKQQTKKTNFAFVVKYFLFSNPNYLPTLPPSSHDNVIFDMINHYADELVNTFSLVVVFVNTSTPGLVFVCNL